MIYCHIFLFIIKINNYCSISFKKNHKLILKNQHNNNKLININNNNEFLKSEQIDPKLSSHLHCISIDGGSPCGGP